mgnify:CR=1 FL=1
MERVQQQDCTLSFSEDGIVLVSKVSGEERTVLYEKIKEIREESEDIHVVWDGGEKIFWKKYMDLASMERLGMLAEKYCADKFVREIEEKEEELSVFIPAGSGDMEDSVLREIRVEKKKEMIRTMTEGFIREVEILENRTNRMFGMGLVVMGIIASYFCESSGFSYIYAVLAALSGGVLIGYRTALHILTAGIVWICRIPPIHDALKKRAVNGGKGYRIGEDGIYDLGTGAMYPYDRLRTVIETKEELSVGSVFTFEKNIDPDQFARLRTRLKKYVPDKYRYYEFLEKEEKDGRGKWARCVAAAAVVLFVLAGRFLLPPWYELDRSGFLAVPMDVYRDSLYR